MLTMNPKRLTLSSPFARRPPAFLLAWLLLAGPSIELAPPATAADPLEEINKRFQQRQQESDLAVLDVQQQYHAKRAAMEAQWRQRERDLEARWQQVQREIEQKWEQVRRSSDKEWVDYSSTYEGRSAVDFENGAIEITVLVPIGDAGSSQHDPQAILSAMREMQGDARAASSVRAVATAAADPASVMIARAALPAAWTKIMQQFEQVFSQKTPSGRGVLANQVTTKAGAPVNQHTVKSFVEAEVLPTATVEEKPVQSHDGVTRAKVTVSLPMVQDHLRQRAQLYQEEITAHAKRYGLDPRLLFAIVHTQSYFNPLAQTPVPSYGLMLLTPRGAARDAYNFLYKDDIVLDDAYLQDPAHNVELGAAYLHLLRRQLVPNLEEGEKKNYLVACAYNWGPGNLREKVLKQARVQDLTPTQVFTLLTQQTPEETRIYLKRVKDRISLYEELSKR